LLWEIRAVKTVTADGYKRVRLPRAKPGQVFALVDEGGKFILTPLQKAEPKVVYGKLSKDGLTFELPKGYALSEEEIADAIREERQGQSERANRP
jgi:hypothetical protein